MLQLHETRLTAGRIHLEETFGFVLPQFSDLKINILQRFNVTTAKEIKQSESQPSNICTVVLLTKSQRLNQIDWKRYLLCGYLLLTLSLLHFFLLWLAYICVSCEGCYTFKYTIRHLIIDKLPNSVCLLILSVCKQIQSREIANWRYESERSLQLCGSRRWV